MKSRVAILDSGVHAAHPHVGGVAGGVRITAWGDHPDYTDLLGHGTAVAGVIREAAPLAEIYAVKVFDRALAAPLPALVRAIRWCIAQDMDVINLSLGTSRAEHAPVLREAVDEARAAGLTVISAAEMNGAPAYPGSLPGVVGVWLDDTLAYGEVAGRIGGFAAGGWPRPIQDRAKEDNLHGISFAVARVSGLLANRTLPPQPGLAHTQPLSR